MKKRMISVLLVISIIAALALTGCSGGQSTEAAETPEETVSIRISAINALPWAPVYIAQTEGFFEKNGLEVEFTSPGGPKGFQAMHAGDCEFSMLSQEPLLMAQEQGLESMILAGMTNKSTSGIVASKDITDVSQLAGKAIYGRDPGSAPYLFVCNALKLNGVDPSEVDFVQVADENAGLQALLNGEVSASFIDLSMLPSLEGFEYNILVDTREADQSEKYYGSTDYPGGMLCATKEYVENNPEICQKVVNSIIDAQKWIAESSAEDVAASLSSVFGDIDVDLLTEEVKLCKDSFATDGIITEKGEAAIMKTCVETGVVKEEIPYDTIIDMSFAENYGK